MNTFFIILFFIACLGLFWSWVGYAVSGFKHHFYTGIIALIPFINLLVLPTLWHRAGKYFLAGVFWSIVIAISVYFKIPMMAKHWVSLLQSDPAEMVNAVSGHGESNKQGGSYATLDVDLKAFKVDVISANHLSQRQSSQGARLMNKANKKEQEIKPTTQKQKNLTPLVNASVTDGSSQDAGQFVPKKVDELFKYRHKLLRIVLRNQRELIGRVVTIKSKQIKIEIRTDGQMKIESFATSDVLRLEVKLP